ncbi:MAG TPA: helix-turn-helix domain-containing protein [Nitratidesulfovibrio sp.]|nr:helix-turn-helix domain-containing protein [Nitratidesulfovibrio sp.]
MSEAQGVNSVEIAVSVLDVVSKSNGPVRAVDIAKAVGLSKSRLHKYLVSLCRCGMLHQNPRTTLYTLGFKILNLSEAAERHNSVLISVNNALCRMRDNLNVSTGLAIQRGDTLLLTRYNRSNKDVDIDYRDDTLLPIESSAAGKIFQVFSDAFLIDSAMDSAEFQKIKRQKYAVRSTATEGIPGAKAIACPVFNRENVLVGAAVTMGFLPDSATEQHALALHLMEAVQTATKA